MVSVAKVIKTVGSKEAKEIASNGYNKLLQYHTTKQRGQQFLSLLEKYL